MQKPTTTVINNSSPILVHRERKLSVFYKFTENINKYNIAKINLKNVMKIPKRILTIKLLFQTSTNFIRRKSA